MSCGGLCVEMEIFLSHIFSGLDCFRWIHKLNYVDSAILMRKFPFLLPIKNIFNIMVIYFRTHTKYYLLTSHCR